MEPKMLLLELLEVLNGFGFAACPSYEMSTLHTVSTVTLFNSTSTERRFKRRFWFYYHLPLRPARWHLPLPYFQGTSTTQICCSSDASCLIAWCTVQKSTIRWCLIYTKNSIFAYCIIPSKQIWFPNYKTQSWHSWQPPPCSRNSATESWYNGWPVVTHTLNKIDGKVVLYVKRQCDIFLTRWGRGQL